ncbi:response regulator transcription factor [Vineibacter terrae]|uniref:response regulator transcription factor n=1 Tax=Vineibacter terrae TaxID=2586908 RepID=UPI002E306D2D|nr:response regulator [Vineibacter terrae]HEX2885629.1 response regulator [Vineibacter terrae]
MSTAPFTIYLVDDDAGVLKALARLLAAHGYDVRAFTSARDFLGAHDPTLPGCAVLDVAMPDLDGLQLQQALAEGGAGLPVIFVTGRGDIPTSVRAMKAGAADFLTKPVKEEDLLDAISRIREREALQHHERQELQAIRSRLATLTPREHEVLTHVITGRLNKQIAFDLGTVEKTIKVHRGRMMEKMGVRSVAELVRMAERVGIRPSTA